jgi:hypothetical protein
VELDRAEAIVKDLLSPKYLSIPQQMVFRAAWQGQSYRSLAASAGYQLNYLKGVGAQVWRILAIATSSKVTKANFKQIIESFADSEDLLVLEPESLPSGIDWGEAMDVSAFYGRELERRQLQQWILTERCRLVAILGMGGMGKTTISIELLRQFQAEANSQDSTNPAGFDRIIWRSLLNAPPLKELLPELIRMLVIAPVGRSVAKSPTSRIEANRVDFKPIPKTVIGQIELLLEICQKYRCLIVLDNGESIFQSGAHVGQYRTGYADYGNLFSTLGRMNHQSCLLLTSREKPTEISQLEGVNTKVRTLVLPGLDPSAGQQIFVDRGCLPIGSLE